MEYDLQAWAFLIVLLHSLWSTYMKGEGFWQVPGVTMLKNWKISEFIDFILVMC